MIREDEQWGPTDLQTSENQVHTQHTGGPAYLLERVCTGYENALAVCSFKGKP